MFEKLDEFHQSLPTTQAAVNKDIIKSIVFKVNYKSTAKALFSLLYIFYFTAIISILYFLLLLFFSKSDTFTFNKTIVLHRYKIRYTFTTNT